MAGYSGTPLPKKLGIKPGSRLVVESPPDGFAEILAPLPDGVQIGSLDGGPVDVLLLFSREAAELSRRFPEVAARIAPAGGLWIAWPKQASKLPTDLNENVIRAIGLAAGLVDTKVCAIDQVWSGLRFVYRRADRPVAGSPRRSPAMKP